MYKYLYKHYLWLFHKWRPKDIPEWNSVFALSFFFMPNFFLLLFFLGKVLDKKVVSLIGYLGIPFYIGFVVVNYVVFIRNRKYQDLLNEFYKSDKKERDTGFTIVILLAIEAFLIPILLLITDGFGYYR